MSSVNESLISVSEHDYIFHPAAVIDPSGARWEYYYADPESDSEQARSSVPVSVIDPVGYTYTLEYSAGGEIASVTGSDGWSVSMEHDSWGNISRIIDAAQRVWQYSYNPLSQVEKITDPSGAYKSFEYSPDGTLRSVINEEGEQTDLHYSVWNRGAYTTQGNSRSVEIVDAARRVTKQRFEELKTAFGELSTPKWSEVSEEEIIYNSAGYPVEYRDANNGITRYEWDAAGRLVQIISPAHRMSTVEYDSCGRPVVLRTRTAAPYGLEELTDSNSRTVRCTYDLAGQLVARESSDGLSESFDYDLCGRLVRARVGEHESLYTYDECSRLIESFDSLTGTCRYIYNAAGRLVRTIDALNQETTYSYDSAGYLVQQIDTRGNVTDFSRDFAGRITAVSGGAADIHCTYDKTGRIVERTDGVRNESTAYNGQSVESRVNNTLSAVFERNALGAVISAQSASDSSGSLEPREEYRYDCLGLLMENYQPELRPVDTLGESVSYPYDFDGYRTSTHSYFGSQTYRYDGLGALIDQAQAVQSVQNSTQEIAPEGSRIERVYYEMNGRSVMSGARAHDGSIEYLYDAAGQLLSATAGSARAVWVYSNGVLHAERMEQRIGGTWRSAMVREYTYNDRAQLVASVQRTLDPVTGYRVDNSAVRWEYTYSAAGERLSETMSGDDGARVRREFTWNNRGLLGSVLTVRGVDSFRSVLGAVPACAQRFSFEYSARGVLRSIRDSAGRQVQLTWDYSAAVPALLGARVMSVAGERAVSADSAATGMVLGSYGLDPWSAQMVGQELIPGVGFDGEGSILCAGLRLLGVRWADGASRKFLSADPWFSPVGAAWGADSYALLGNNPVECVDPCGYRPLSRDAMLDSSIEGWMNRNSDTISAMAKLGAFLLIVATFPFSAPASLAGYAGMTVAFAGVGALNGLSNGIDSHKGYDGRVDWSAAAGDSWTGAQVGALEGAAWMLGMRALSLGGRWLARTPLGVRASNALSNGASRVMEGMKRSAQAATASVLSLELTFRSIPRLPRVPGVTARAVSAAPRAVDSVMPWVSAAVRAGGVRLAPAARAVRGAGGLVRPVLIHGVRGAAAGAAVNAVAYPVIFVLNPDSGKQWDWEGYKASTVTAAVGNGLGGFASPVAGSLSARFSGRWAAGVEKGTAVVWGIGSGYAGIYAGNAYFGRSVSYGDVVYYGVANGLIAYAFPAPHVGSLSSFSQMGRPVGWGGYPKSYSVGFVSDGSLVLYPYVTAGWAGLSDYGKTVFVDAYINNVNLDIEPLKEKF
ncbi:MAG: hypothetical protein Q4P78_05920 [Rothia sp. (in: high G+C Gram-positive bacteria)]|uniref:hypothetical protein n=1 Tax=Rothia sp. (in: high G+C Gram-positive bacteria) TaxID=1885016 RepID=UPI0026DEEC78|nr:hypothetical protein [Rothia sp. (in: high G+C Gram-positive bacteria)]MDO5750726.1 hypothetical protein [Rothia sp. (in: high G+C Gram-positive bacteria)]